ncbi:hypothetical protein EVAR_22440_1 [Eumeta japonica]|uniref:Uncharacterized protein n=1 Tax=Eumeta variegata TaxID=151549 RepID=A0A4C1ZZG0_EUMVA|nr:hypothetical protein EVAR_22440_1 [Eumeta japonica]
MQAAVATRQLLACLVDLSTDNWAKRLAERDTPTNFLFRIEGLSLKPPTLVPWRLRVVNDPCHRRDDNIRAYRALRSTDRVA